MKTYTLENFYVVRHWNISTFIIMLLYLLYDIIGGAKSVLFITPFTLNLEQNENILLQQNKDACNKKY